MRSRRTALVASPSGLHRRHRRGWPIVAIGALVGVLVVSFGGSVPAGASGSTEQIEGAGSSWAANAISQWISDVGRNGLQIVYTPSGSATGRQDFAQGVTDFAVSDTGFLGIDPVSGQDDVSSRPYAYLPVVGGGTAFPYHITVAGQLVRNLRLSQQTLAMIFTDEITNWDDPHITADNNGRQFPSIPIVPVVHSEGAGTTYQLTDWLSSLFGPIWKKFSGYSFPVEYWPSGKGSQVPLNNSDSVMNFVASAAGNGSIGFDEYSYALAENYPVAKVENAGGYFTAPDQYNVAVALTQAQINYTKGPDYLLEQLNHVWTYTDPRTYPLSSYSYMIEPTASSDPTMDTGKRQTLLDYMTYSLCPGQAEMGPIGYSPLPINLVSASFQQLQLEKQADPNVSLTNVNVDDCNNPTFDPKHPSVNKLAEIAPQPPACDKAGQGPCAANVGIYLGNPVGNTVSSPAGAGTGSGGGGSGSGGSGGGSGSSGGGGSAGSGSSSGSSAEGSSASNTSGGSGSAARVVSAAGNSNSGGNSQPAGSGSKGSQASGAVVPTPVVTTLAAASPGRDLIEFLAVALLLLALVTPPLLSRYGPRRRGRGGPGGGRGADP